MSLLYGADYNPEQWMDRPDILEKDIELMKQAGCNVMSIGIFGWTFMEPEEGKYDFSFYEDIINRLYRNGIKTILATPSAAMPAWLSHKYPEVLRTDGNGVRHRHGNRQNICLTSPVLRRKVREINEQLALKFKDNPAILAWHVSNEYFGACRCGKCAEAFRIYLKERYSGSLDELNHEWWNSFWSHTYTEWEQIEPPMDIGETSSNALKLNWKRFETKQTIDFYKNEIEPLKRINPDIPVTTNFHCSPDLFDYSKFAKYVDFVCWDAYPMWHAPNGNADEAAQFAFVYDFCRSAKGKPFLLMESTPSNVNWSEYNKLKRPKMNNLSSLQAVSCGSDSVQYFQWRKSRGSAEKFHGAVVDHCGHGNTRVFRETAELGEILAHLGSVEGSAVTANAAVIYDAENSWALGEANGFQIKDKKYKEECIKFHKSLCSCGVNADVIDSEHSFDGYSVIFAPMLYMIKPNVEKRLAEYVKNGGILVSGYMSGFVNSDDLCYLGGFPCGELKEVFGIWNEETDTLYPGESNIVDMNGKKYPAHDYCEVIHAESAQVLARYESDFYAGNPAVTVNKYGNGKAYYIAFRSDDEFACDFCNMLGIGSDGARRFIDYPAGVSVRTREDDENIFFFVQNFNDSAVCVNLTEEFTDVQNGKKISGSVELSVYDTLILRKIK